MPEMIFRPDLVMKNSGEGGIRGSLGRSSGFRVGEPTSI